MKTAFPWLPAMQWRRDDRPRCRRHGGVECALEPCKRDLPEDWEDRIRWTVRVEAPIYAREYLQAVEGSGYDPRAAVNDMRDHVAWWLDWDGRRGKTVGEKYPPREDEKL